MNMLINYYRKTVLMVLIMMAAMVFTVPSNAALVNYSQNFEGLNHADASALGNDGWLVFANVPAPNNGAGSLPSQLVRVAQLRAHSNSQCSAITATLIMAMVNG